MKTDVDRLFGGQRRALQVSTEQYNALVEAVDAAVPNAVLKRLTRELALEPAADRLHFFAQQARRLAARLQKQISVEVDAGGVYLDDRPWSPFWIAFTHGLRNAVDHGIESAQERRLIGKPTKGRITLRARTSDTGIVFEIADDGRGIDWDAVRARCESKGLRAASRDDLVAGLFADGISTASEVTDISGRGVGMGVLRTAVQELGGQFDLSSEAGQGTVLSMSFPVRMIDGFEQAAPAA